MNSISISIYSEPITPRQVQFIERLGFAAEGFNKHTASRFIDTILRPVGYAVKGTFPATVASFNDEHYAVVPKEEMRALQIAVARWEHCKNLPGYGPGKTLRELGEAGALRTGDITKEEKMAVVDIAAAVLSPDVFRWLKAAGVQKYKNLVDQRVLAAAANLPPVIAAPPVIDPPVIGSFPPQ